MIFGVPASLCDSVSLATGGRSEKRKHANAHKLGVMGKRLLENLHRGEEPLVPQQLNCEVFLLNKVKLVTG